MSRAGNPQDLEGATVVSAEAAPEGEGDWWVLRLRLADGRSARLYADAPEAYVDAPAASPPIRVPIGPETFRNGGAMSAVNRCGYHRGATYGPRCTLEAGHAGAHAWEERRPWAAPDPMAEGVPAADFTGHPGVNAKQRARIAGAVEADPGARILGMDENERPVVRYRCGVPREPLDFAVLKSGEVDYPGRIREGWRR